MPVISTLTYSTAINRYTYEIIYEYTGLPECYIICLLYLMNYYYIYTYYKMSHHQILPPPPTVEDTMYNVSLIFYNGVGCAFHFEGWQEELWHGLPQLLQCSPPIPTKIPSTNSCYVRPVYSYINS